MNPWPVPRDAAIGALVFAVALGVVGLGSLARARGWLGVEAGRKAIHVGVGFIPFAIVWGIEDVRWALLTAAAFVAANAVDRAWHLFPAMAGGRRQDWGTLLYPLAMLGLIAAFWHTARPLAAVAMGPMIWGDAAAALVGRRWGRRALIDLPGQRKTWAGSAAMAAASFGALVATAPLLRAALPWPASPAAWAALAAVAVVLASVEAASPHGLDNLSVPWVAAALLWVAAADPHGAALRFWLGLAGAIAIACAAERAGALDRSGALAAVVVGTTVFGLGGWRWALVLVGYFVGSTAAGRLRLRGGRCRLQDGRPRPGGGWTGPGRQGWLDAPGAIARAGAEAYVAKGGRRDLAQVFANGGVAAGAAVLAPWLGMPAAFAAFIGALSASAADTWATEIGAGSARPPRLITTGRPVSPGTSGGVTALGLGGSLAGAASVGLLAAAAAASSNAWFWIALALVAGVAGSLLDSLLGAAWQAVRRCPACGEETERLLHGCGTPTVHARGLRWLGNDAVNLACTASGALIGWFCWAAGG